MMRTINAGLASRRIETPTSPNAARNLDGTSFHERNED